MGWPRFGKWLGWEARLDGAARLARRYRPRLELLEDRAVPSAASLYVNDNWHFLTDADASNSLTAGDVVTSQNDTSPMTPITATYGVDAFGTVTTGAFPGALTGLATINDAIAAAP